MKYKKAKTSHRANYFMFKTPLIKHEFLLDLQSHSMQINFLEKEKLGFDHADLGASLLKKWNLSGFHMGIDAFHHKPKNSLHFAFESVHPSFF
jgi:hypothetical protein